MRTRSPRVRELASAATREGELADIIVADFDWRPRLGENQGNAGASNSPHHLVLRDEYLLLREMHHRMANTLTLLTTVLREELRPVATPATRDSLSRCEARIVAFGKLNRMLTVGTGKALIAVRKYIEELCRALSEALLRPIGVRCEVCVSDGAMPSENCERLGLVIAELVTNAAKHAFAGRDDGVVRIDVTNERDHWLCMVSDNGAGIKMSACNAGSRILEKLARSIGGRLTIRTGAQGTSVMIACCPADASMAQMQTQ